MCTYRSTCMLSLYTYTHWSPEKLQQQTCTLLRWLAALHKTSVHFHSCTPISNSEQTAGWGKQKFKDSGSSSQTHSVWTFQHHIQNQLSGKHQGSATKAHSSVCHSSPNALQVTFLTYHNSSISVSEGFNTALNPRNSKWTSWQWPLYRVFHCKSTKM